ncbi:MULTISPECIES: DUF3293 domain-containing protein [unclassified Aureispira]|uniref:DUF3293 domain-containing protein n=1 Tax=unclassified Aureispira TaxID=2649989 RepID=UPI000698B417|nr:MULTISPECIES: DUF3293 domain-containing protein [unclassified Aureispira]WMX15751.1 DUF3293 domain-containing protein [Aureispira sp. CCB-E]
MNTFLEQAYLSTTYEVYNQEEIYQLRIKKENELFLSFCEREGIKTWAIITAYNPYSKECSLEMNQANNEQLKQTLIDTKCIFFEANGVPDNSSWEAEKSYFVCNLSLESGKEIGRQYQQNAIVYGGENRAPQLVWLV